jgi:hypothetical protein
VQVIENLVGNALKFSPRESTIELALLGGDGTWRIEVRDEGPGVPEAERAVLFQKFHRGSPTDRRREQHRPGIAYREDPHRSDGRPREPRAARAARQRLPGRVRGESDLKRSSRSQRYLARRG